MNNKENPQINSMKFALYDVKYVEDRSSWSHLYSKQNSERVCTITDIYGTACIKRQAFLCYWNEQIFKPP